MNSIGGTRRGARSVLAIDGIDGSGKSRFADALAAACAHEGAPAVVLHVDDFRRPLDWAGRDEAALYYERYYDLALLDDCLRRFLDGTPAASVPRFDPEREALDGSQELRFGDAPLVIVEGIFVLRLRAAAAAPLVTLEVTEEEARRRIVARDLARGRPRHVIEHRIARRYEPAQARYRAAFDPAARADVLVDNERWDTARPVRCELGRFPPAAARALQGLVRGGG